MTPERWQQIEEIFHEALELDGATREKFIDQAAGDDAELKSEVAKLLSQFDDASSFMEQPLYDSGKNEVLSSLLDSSGDDPMGVRREGERKSITTGEQASRLP